jgi:hypothetical protein
MLSIQEAEELLKINRDDLSEEVSKQPELFYEVARNMVMAISLRDEASDILDKVDAESDALIRLKAERGGEKVTEAKIKQAVILDPEHVKASNNYLRAKNEVDRWSILKESFMQRANMLRELAGLTIAGYMVSTVTSKDSSVVSEARYQESKKRLRDRA